MSIALSLNELENSGLIRQAQVKPELEYIFRHALVQDAAYDSILKADRKKLHFAVAHEMELIYPEWLDELAALLAGHYREAGEKQKAYEYYKRAAKHSSRKFANGEAEYNLRAAMELCQDDHERAELNLQLGQVLSTSARLDESEEYLRAALLDYRAQGAREQVALIYNVLAQNYWTAGKISQMLAIAREGLQDVGEMPASGNFAELLRYTSSGCIFTGQISEAQDYAARALAVAKECGAKDALAQALVNKALIENRLGKDEQAITSLEEAIVHAEEAKNYHALSRARNNLAYVYGDLGKNLEAAAQHEYMVEVNRKINSIAGEVWSLTQLNNLYIDLGKMNEARALLDKMDELLQASGGKAHRLMVILSKLQTLVYSGNCAETIAELTSVRDECLANEEKQLVIATSYTISLAYSMMRDYDRAGLEMQRGIESSGIWGGANFQYLLASLQVRGSADLSVAQKTIDQADQTIDGEPSFAATVTRLYAVMHIRAREGKFGEALNFAGELADLYAKNQYRWLRALVLREAGEIALKANDKTIAKELLQLALNEYHEMHIPIYAAQVGETLNNL